jgi:hypothetical protein
MSQVCYKCTPCDCQTTCSAAAGFYLTPVEAGSEKFRSCGGSSCGMCIKCGQWPTTCPSGSFLEDDTSSPCYPASNVKKCTTCISRKPSGCSLDAATRPDQGRYRGVPHLTLFKDHSLTELAAPPAGGASIGLGRLPSSPLGTQRGDAAESCHTTRLVHRLAILPRPRIMCIRSMYISYDVHTYYVYHN